MLKNIFWNLTWQMTHHEYLPCFVLYYFIYSCIRNYRYATKNTFFCSKYFKAFKVEFKGSILSSIKYVHRIYLYLHYAILEIQKAKPFHELQMYVCVQLNKPFYRNSFISLLCNKVESFNSKFKSLPGKEKYYSFCGTGVLDIELLSHTSTADIRTFF